MNHAYEELLRERGISAPVREEMLRIENVKTKWYLVFLYVILSLSLSLDSLG